MSEKSSMVKQNETRIRSLQDDLKLLEINSEQYVLKKKIQINSCKKKIAQYRNSKMPDAKVRIEELTNDLTDLELRKNISVPLLKHLIQDAIDTRFVETGHSLSSTDLELKEERNRKLNILFKEGYKFFSDAIRLGFGVDMKSKEFKIKSSDLKKFVLIIDDETEDDSDSDTSYDDSDEESDDNIDFLSSLMKLAKEKRRGVSVFDILRVIGGMKMDEESGTEDEKDSFNRKFNQFQKQMRKLPPKLRRKVKAMLYFKTAYDNFLRAYEIFNIENGESVYLINVKKILKGFKADKDCIISKACAEFEMTPRYEKTFYNTVTFNSFMAGISLIVQDYCFQGIDQEEDYDDFNNDSSDDDSSDDDSSDGDSSEIEFEDVRATFKKLDINGDGFITKKELRIGMKSMGCNLSESDIDEMMEEADVDGDNKISFEEFTKLWYQ